MSAPGGPGLAAVLARHRDQLLAIPGVTACGEAQEAGRPCIRVYVNPAQPPAPGRLPDMLEGFPVVTRPAGPLQAR